MTRMSGMIASFLFRYSVEKQENIDALIAFIQTYIKHNIGYRKIRWVVTLCVFSTFDSVTRHLVYQKRSEKKSSAFFLYKRIHSIRLISPHIYLTIMRQNGE